MINFFSNILIFICQVLGYVGECVIREEKDVKGKKDLTEVVDFIVEVFFICG